MRDYAAEVRALTDAGATDAQAAELLVKRGPGEAETFEVWAENLEAVLIFCALQTQWHVAAGMSALVRTGLIYSEATNLMRERGIGRKRRAELLDDLRLMEIATIEAWSAG